MSSKENQMIDPLASLKKAYELSAIISRECWRDLMPRCRACNPWHAYMSDVMGRRASLCPCDSCEERLAVVKEVKRRIQEEKENEKNENDRNPR